MNRIRRTIRSVIALSSLAALLTAPAAWAQLKIYNIDVGQGDATLVIAPDKTAMLVDAGRTGTGSPYTNLLTFINGKISSGEIVDFKYVVCTHYDQDHIGGMGGADGVINNASHAPEFAYDRGGGAGTEQYTDYINAISAKGVTRHAMALGEVITLDGAAGVTAQCIAVNGQVMGHGAIPGANDENELSLILLLTYGGFDYLFMGDTTGGLISGESDIEGPVGDAIKNSLKRGVDILQVSHHGSHTASNLDFLTTIRPENAVISVGNGNAFGHPRQEALNRLESFPRTLPDRPDLRPADGTGVLNIYQTELGSGGTSPSVKTASDTTDTEGILISTANGINYTVQSFGGSHIPATSFIADDVAAVNDLDGDGLRDTTEDKNGNGVVDGDTNGNGVVDPGEAFSESNPRTGDTDADGISDGVEDCGSDGVPNILEPGFNPSTNPDPNGDDYNKNTNPYGTEGNAQVDDWPGEKTDSTNSDTDGDGLKDGQEDTNANGIVDAGETDPTDPDSDNDNVSDGPLDPDGGGPIMAGPDAFPLDPAEQWDTDGDGTGNNTDTDDDDDGILDAHETDTGVYVSPTDTGTDPLLADTDGDGALDGFEVDNGFDPNNAASYPKVVINEVLWNPDGEDDGKEYLELYNPQKSAIDVSNFVIQCGYTTTFYDNVFIPENTVIPSNGYYLIAEGGTVTDVNGYPPDLIADLDLQNAGDGNADGVRLVSPTKATVFDCILYGSATVTLPAAGAATDKIPTEKLISRVVPGVDNDLCRDFRNAPVASPTSSLSHPFYPGVNVKLNEVCYEPAGDDTANEWIELYNPDDRTVDISGFRVQSGGGAFANNGDPLPAGTYMFPKSYFLIGRSGVASADWTGLGGGDFQNGDQYTYYLGEWHYSASPTDAMRIILPANEGSVDMPVDTLLYDEPNTDGLPGDSVSQNLIPDYEDPGHTDAGFSLARAGAGVDTNDTTGAAPYYDWAFMDAAGMTPTKKYTDTDVDGIADIVEPAGDPDGDGLQNAGDTDSDGDTILDGLEDANQNGTYEADGINSAGSAFYAAYHTPKETSAYAADTDGDGLRDDFEIDGGLDPRDDGTIGESAPGLKDGPNGASADPDGDGLTNLQEYLGKDTTAPALGIRSFDTDSTDPLNPDSDGDGMPDGWEVTNDLDPLSASDASLDPDVDGLTNLAEYVNGSEIGDGDTDNDGMPDGWEVARSLDPLSASGANGAGGDPDLDGLSNYAEYLGRDATPPAGTDDSTRPLNADTDSDGLTDGVETHTHTYVSPSDTGTDPNSADTDADTLPDGWEVAEALSPVSASGVDGANGDPDGDELANLDEYHSGVNSTDPHDPDSDDDGLGECWEYDYGLDPNDASGVNGPDGDPDSDGLRNLVEYNSSTNPYAADSDSDGLTDYNEILQYGSLPYSASSPAYAQAGEVLVNEYFAAPVGGAAASDADGNGVGDSDADEFVEFVNVTANPVRLDGYQFTAGSSPAWGSCDLQFPAGTILAAGEALVIFDDSAVPTGSFGSAQVINCTNDLSLANGGSTITLWGSGGSIVVDQYVYPSAPSGRSRVLSPEPNTAHTFITHPLLGSTYFSPGKKMGGGAFNDLDVDGTPNSADTDDDADGIPDIWEIYFGSDPRSDGSVPGDSDGDGLSDGNLANSEEWMDTDDDDDGIPDSEEINYDGNAAYNPYDPASNPTGTDLDITKWDTDGDGVADDLEIAFDSNPIDPGTRPGAYKFNFQPAASEAPEGFIADAATPFAQGHGWQ